MMLYRSPSREANDSHRPSAENDGLSMLSIGTTRLSERRSSA
jgi:hypothetical protein